MWAARMLLLLPWLLPAQSPENAGLVRGVVLECDAKPSGELSIRTADNQVLRYQFDAKTYAERDQKLIEAARIQVGEQVEIVSDRTAGSLIRCISPRPRLRGRARAQA